MSVAVNFDPIECRAQQCYRHRSGAVIDIGPVESVVVASIDFRFEKTIPVILT